jgi:hypothetical protein
VLLTMYVLGVPVFGFLAWAFSGAGYVGQLDDRHSRRLLSVVAGFLWPLILVGMAQLVGIRLLVKFSRARQSKRLSSTG